MNAETLDLLVSRSDPVVVGGVGGSGTRLIAQCLKQLGFFIGYDLNISDDNLWFTLLFRRPDIFDLSDEEFDELVDIFLTGMSGSNQFTERQVELINWLASTDRGHVPATWLKQRARTLLSKKPAVPTATGWGWKAPNSHIILDRLLNRFNRMKYILVARNGLDMAFSRNQNQLRLWGKHFFGDQFEICPRLSLKYWCIVHRRVLDIGKSMGDNFLFISYDRFCSDPGAGATELCNFLGLDDSGMLTSSILKLVRPPKSIGRFRNHDIALFDKEDVAYVRELGFDVD